MSDSVSLRLQAAAGDPRAQTDLAQTLLLAGRTGEAMQLLNAACRQNFAPALLQHAALATLGFARPRDFGQALQIVEHAAAAGEAEARAQLAVIGQARDVEWWLAPPAAEQHFDAPRVFTIKNFLTPEVCAWLIKKAERNLQPSTIRDSAGGYVPDPARSCSNAGFSQLAPDIVLQLISLRIAAALKAPLPQHETTNILCYARGQEYRPHYDFITPNEEAAFADELQRSGQRIATLLVYLNDEYDGGETEFPRLDWSFKGGVGDALIFWNLSAQGAREPDSLHAGRPVINGKKWLLSKWVREKPVPFS